MSQSQTRSRSANTKCHISNVLGRPQRIEGQICLGSNPGEVGHLIYGPYEIRSPGAYRVDFPIAIDAVPPSRIGDFVCATLDVTTNSGATVLGQRHLRKAELSSELTPFGVEFTLQAPRELEYRVWSTGQAGLTVSGSPIVTRLPEETLAPAPAGNLERIWDNESEFLDGYLRNVTGLIHVGANTGQERLLYRLLGLDVVWVEPIQEVYDKLLDNIAGLRRQRAFKALVTDKEEEDYTFRIANNFGASSSILAFDRHAELFPDIHYVESRKLTSTTLESLMKREGLATDGYQALTLDVGSAELMVLRGAADLLKSFRYVKCEVADFPTRVGSPTNEELDEFLKDAGFGQLIRRPFAYGPDGDGAYWDTVWKKSSDTEPLHRPGVSLPMIATDASGWEKAE